MMKIKIIKKEFENIKTNGLKEEKFTLLFRFQPILSLD